MKALIHAACCVAAAPFYCCTVELLVSLLHHFTIACTVSLLHCCIVAYTLATGLLQLTIIIITNNCQGVRHTPESRTSRNLHILIPLGWKLGSLPTGLPILSWHLSLTPISKIHPLPPFPPLPLSLFTNRSLVLARPVP